MSSPLLYRVPAAAGAGPEAVEVVEAADSLREELSWREELRVRTVVSSCWRSITARASEVLRSLEV